MTLGVSVHIYAGLGKLAHLGLRPIGATSYVVPHTDSGELWLLCRSHFLSIDMARGDCLVPTWPTRQQ